ncbi:alpha/beta hydrolase [Deltaproteobacteria bacterium]|nr:alpha/beta hydrolase [Deltaproteobacteria bacterium]
MKRTLLMVIGVLALITISTPCLAQEPRPGGGPASWPTGRPPEPPPLDVSAFTNKWLDLAYADQSESQKLDIYLPAEGKGPFPVVVYIHGGGWAVSDKRSMELEPVLKSCLAHGYAVVSANQRPSREALFPAQIKDVKAAIRWIRANGKRYELNPGKIGAWGSSSGGHLVALLGTTGWVKEFDDINLGNPNESSSVQAVIDVSGPINFLTMDEQLKKNGFTDFAPHGDAAGPESSLLGKPIGTVPELVKTANPETYIRKDASPMLLAYGAKDNSVPVQQATDFAAKLRDVIGNEKVSLVIFPEGGHGGGESFNSQENMNRLFSFLDRHLK